MSSFDVRVFAIRRRPGRMSFEVRWRVAGRDRSRSFMTRALAACPRTGTAWTSAGTSLEPRGLKHRPDGTIRIAPIPPVLVRMLRQHLHAFGTTPDRRPFGGTRGGMLGESVSSYGHHDA